MPLLYDRWLNVLKTSKAPYVMPKLIRIKMAIKTECRATSHHLVIEYEPINVDRVQRSSPTVEQEWSLAESHKLVAGGSNPPSATFHDGG